MKKTKLSSTYKMFKFIKQIFVSTIMFFGSISSVNTSKCVSMSNQKCKVRPEIVNVNRNEPLFYPFGIKTSKCSSSCNNINEPYAKLCVPNVVKNLNSKVFNLMSRTNETRQIKQHETCKCKCTFDASVCYNKQRWNEHKCMWECKELIDKGVCDKGFIWNPRNCDCECDKSCDIGEYLDYSNCKCRKRLVDKLFEECIKIINEKEITGIKKDENKCSPCVVYRVLFWIFFTLGIAVYFVYYKYMSRNKENVSEYDYNYRVKNY